ncbi:uncharacterized protein PV06_05226 [Exophiala oligosperma]|uniref:BZIP domain-containing protein n=1 Tax=Exophiala oligosperma TaxID=215243 RepID=A0A0D2DML4_9EURO|nr:uncharacterized protein PV06_05226 [Exophiala oligosperma]KIW44198.1 hypothetical protein PV06_05226 [Exophiala oligosperma]
MNREDRRVRNRLSQKAFRARQALRIKELEQRLENLPESESERVSQLEEHNTLLRQRLFDNHKKMESLQVSLKALIDSTAKYLDLMINEDTTCRGEEVSSAKNSSPQAPEEANFPQNASYPLVGVPCPSAADNSICENLFDFDTSIPQAQEIDTVWIDDSLYSYEISHESQKDPHVSADRQLDGPSNMRDQIQSSVLLANGKAASSRDNCLNDPVSQLPLSFTLAQFGPASYAAASQAGPLLFTGAQGQLHATHSMLSNHIGSMEYFLKLNLSTSRRSQNRNISSHLDDHITAAVSLIFSTFVAMSWHTMTAWHAYLKVQPDLTSLMEWRVNPSPKNLSKVPPYYRPTQLQLSVSYPAVIDWMPWPSIRDALITYHSANPRLDDLIFEIASSYVMEIDLSKLVSGFSSTPGYVSVWDLVQAISPETTCTNLPSSTGFSVWNCSARDNASIDKTFDGPSNDMNEGTQSEGSLPASSTRALFQSKRLALQAFKLLGMDHGPHQFRLGPDFFEKHPELYDPNANIMASGVFLHPDRRWSLSHPQPLDTSMLARYREVTSWTLDGYPKTCPMPDVNCLG